MKVIGYRGGLISFRIPAHWREEYEEDGGGTFYEDIANSGTLRVSVITAAKKQDDHQIIDQAHLFDMFRSSTKASEGAVLKLDRGNVLLRYRQCAIEQGEELAMHCWEIGNAMPPDQFKIAVFTYTILETLSSKPPAMTELALLEQEIPKTVFATTLGLSRTRQH